MITTSKKTFQIFLILVLFSLGVSSCALFTKEKSTNQNATPKEDDKLAKEKEEKAKEDEEDEGVGSDFSEIELFFEGIRSYDGERYNLSKTMFQKLVDKFPGSPLTIIAELKAADSLFYGVKYSEAIGEYRDFVSVHSTHEAKPYALYQIGRSYQLAYQGSKQDETPLKEAIKAYIDLINQYPNSFFTQKAKVSILECDKLLLLGERDVISFYIKTGKIDAAIARLKTAKKTYAHVPDVNTLLNFDLSTELSSPPSSTEPTHTPSPESTKNLELEHPIETLSIDPSPSSTPSITANPTLEATVTPVNSTEEISPTEIVSSSMTATATFTATPTAIATATALASTLPKSTETLKASPTPTPTHTLLPTPSPTPFPTPTPTPTATPTSTPRPTEPSLFSTPTPKINQALIPPKGTTLSSLESSNLSNSIIAPKDKTNNDLSGLDTNAKKVLVENEEGSTNEETAKAGNSFLKQASCESNEIQSKVFLDLRNSPTLRSSRAEISNGSFGEKTYKNKIVFQDQLSIVPQAAEMNSGSDGARTWSIVSEKKCSNTTDKIKITERSRNVKDSSGFEPNSILEIEVESNRERKVAISFNSTKDKIGISIK